MLESKAYLRECNVEKVLGEGCTAAILHGFTSINLTLWEKLCHLNDQMIDDQIHMINSTKNTRLGSYLVSTGTMNSCGVQDLECRCYSSVFCVSIPWLAHCSPFFWPSWTECLKFPSTWGAGRCKPLTPTLYFHPRHKDQKCTVTTRAICTSRKIILHSPFQQHNYLDTTGAFHTVCPVSKNRLISAAVRLTAKSIGCIFSDNLITIISWGQLHGYNSVAWDTLVGLGIIYGFLLIHFVGLVNACGIHHLCVLR